MSFNTNIIGVDKEYSVYVPTNYLNYKYIINVTSEYIDLTNVSLLEPDNNYDYIRVFFDRPGLLDYKVYNTTGMTTSFVLLSANLSDDFFARSDAFSICGITLCLVLLLVWVFNCITEFFNKGGLFKI